MNLRIAVASTGAIGAMMGGWLARSGRDVTLISVSRQEQAELLNRQGLTLEGYGPTFHTPVHAVFLPLLSPSEQFDLIFLTMKSNQLENCLPDLVAHLTPDGVLVPMENGINDDLLTRFIGQDRIIKMCIRDSSARAHHLRAQGVVRLHQARQCSAAGRSRGGRFSSVCLVRYPG